MRAFTGRRLARDLLPDHLAVRAIDRHHDVAMDETRRHHASRLVAQRPRPHPAGRRTARRCDRPRRRACRSRGRGSRPSSGRSSFRSTRWADRLASRRRSHRVRATGPSSPPPRDRMAALRSTSRLQAGVRTLMQGEQRPWRGSSQSVVSPDDAERPEACRSCTIRMTSSITSWIATPVVSTATASRARTSGAAARVRSLRSRASRARGHFRERRAGPSRGMERIERSPARAFLGRGVEENLDVRIRKHDRPDVAPLDDDASRLPELALLRVEHLAHAGLTRDGRGRCVDLGSANRLRDVLSVDPHDAVADLQLQTLGDRGHCRLVGEVNPIAQRLPGDSAVHGARVDVPVFETCRDGTRDRALAGARGSVDSDDEPVAHTTAIILAMRRSRTTALTFVAVALVLATGGFVAEYARGAAFVARAAGATGFVRSVADWHRQPVTESSIEIAWRGGSLRGHRYRPARATGRPLLLVPGVHASGIDEPRLIGFARELASMGHTTVTAELSDLAHYSVTARSTGHDRGCRSVAAPAGRSSGGWPDRDDRHQLRRRTVDRRGRPARAPRSGSVRVVVRGARRPAADAALPHDRRCSPMASIGRRTTTESRSSCSA